MELSVINHVTLKLDLSRGETYDVIELPLFAGSLHDTAKSCTIEAPDHLLHKGCCGARKVAGAQGGACPRESRRGAEGVQTRGHAGRQAGRHTRQQSLEGRRQQAAPNPIKPRRLRACDIAGAAGSVADGIFLGTSHHRRSTTTTRQKPEMRFLHTTKLHLVEFQGQRILPSAIPPYAILSHTRAEEEVLFQLQIVAANGNGWELEG